MHIRKLSSISVRSPNIAFIQLAGEVVYTAMRERKDTRLDLVHREIRWLYNLIEITNFETKIIIVT